jgi:membrane-bound serine protease (ClpP class)
MHRIRYLRLLGILGGVLLGPLIFLNAESTNTTTVLKIQGIIDSFVSQYIERGISEAEKKNASRIIIEIDTPGGLDTSMRRITQRILATSIPTLAFIAPTGSRAASAGTFIALACQQVAMAPATTIGAAHPVDIQGKSASKKITQDAVAYLESIARLRKKSEVWARAAVAQSQATTAADAKQMGIADFLATDISDLLNQIQTSHSSLDLVPMTLIESFFHSLANPNIISILFLIGVYGLIYELAAPGAILPGVAGGMALILALVGFDSMPISLGGLLLVSFGALCMVLELFIISHGILGIGGCLSFLLGMGMLFPGTSPAFRIGIPIYVGFLLFAGAYIGVIVMVLHQQRTRRLPVSGPERLLQRQGIIKAITSSGPMVLVAGEEWLAQRDNLTWTLGEEVKIVGVEGLKLKIVKNEITGGNTHAE